MQKKRLVCYIAALKLLHGRHRRDLRKAISVHATRPDALREQGKRGRLINSVHQEDVDMFTLESLPCRLRASSPITALYITRNGTPLKVASGPGFIRRLVAHPAPIPMRRSKVSYPTSLPSSGSISPPFHAPLRYVKNTHSPSALHLP